MESCQGSSVNCLGGCCIVCYSMLDFPSGVPPHFSL